MDPWTTLCHSQLYYNAVYTTVYCLLGRFDENVEQKVKGKVTGMVHADYGHPLTLITSLETSVAR